MIALGRALRPDSRGLRRDRRWAQPPRGTRRRPLATGAHGHRPGHRGPPPDRPHHGKSIQSEGIRQLDHVDGKREQAGSVVGRRSPDARTIYRDDPKSIPGRDTAGVRWKLPASPRCAVEPEDGPAAQIAELGVGEPATVAKNKRTISGGSGQELAIGRGGGGNDTSAGLAVHCELDVGRVGDDDFSTAAP